jgi:hypothetical protein
MLCQGRQFKSPTLSPKIERHIPDEKMTDFLQISPESEIGFWKGIEFSKWFFGSVEQVAVS